MGSKSSPLVSVLIPTLNEENNIQRAIDSVRSQSITDLEILVCDGGSTDNTTDIIESLSDSDLRLISDTDGLMSQYQSLCDAAHGEYLSILDADSVMLSEKLEKQIQVMEAEPNAGAVGTGLQFQNEAGDIVGELEAPIGSEIKWMAVRTNPVHHTTVLFRAKAVESVGGYRERPFGDYDLIARIAKHWELANINEPLTRTLERESRGGRNFSPKVSLLHNTLIGSAALLAMDWTATEFPIALVKRAGTSAHLAYNVLVES